MTKLRIELDENNMVRAARRRMTTEVVFFCFFFSPSWGVFVFCWKVNSQTFFKECVLFVDQGELSGPQLQAGMVPVFVARSQRTLPPPWHTSFQIVFDSKDSVFFFFKLQLLRLELSALTGSRDAQCDGQQRTGCYSAGAALHGDPGTQTAVVQRQTGTAVACPGVLRPPKATTTFAHFDRTGSAGRGALNPFVCAACCVTAPSDHAFRVLQNRK